MDESARIAALEEEISLLKGEIKTILEEVRVAVLDRSNPFISANYSNGSAAPAPAPIETKAPVAVEEPPQLAEPFPLRSARPAVTTQDEIEAKPRRWTVQTLATLMSWTQETAERMTSEDLAIVLSLARYGGLIEEELESTLNQLAGTLDGPERTQKAGMSDFLLALRQLDALLQEEDEGSKAGVIARRAG